MTQKKAQNKWIPLSDGKLTLHRFQDINFEDPARTAITATVFQSGNEVVVQTDYLQVVYDASDNSITKLYADFHG
jgi:hypothetical protein